MEQLHAWLVSLDFRLWFYLHAAWRSEFFDMVMPYVRNQFTWAPIYLFLLAFMPYNFGKRGWIWLIGFILCFAIGDSVSGAFLKPVIQRVRPCNDPRFAEFLQLIVPRSSGWAFPSSHATNHFALGTFAAVTLHGRLKWFWPIPMMWALSVGYAQVYVGVHFPMDVVAGSLLGAAIGLLVAWLYHLRWKLSHVPDSPPVVETVPDELSPNH